MDFLPNPFGNESCVPAVNQGFSTGTLLLFVTNKWLETISTYKKEAHLGPLLFEYIYLYNMCKNSIG